MRICLYFYCSRPPQRAPIKKLIHHGNFSCGAPLTHAAFTPIIFILDGLNVSIFYISQNVLAERRILSVFYINRVSDHLPAFREQPALARFGSVNSSHDKEHRRSTRWPTPAHFLFESASTLGSCKLFPERKGLPVVLC